MEKSGFVRKKIGVHPKLVDRYDTDDEDGRYTPKGKGKKYIKAKKTEAEKLQEGWEDWEYLMRRDLDYETDDTD